MKTRNNTLILAGILVAVLAFWTSVASAATGNEDTVATNETSTETELMETLYQEVQWNHATDYTSTVKIYDAENNLLFEGVKNEENPAYVELMQQAQLLFKTMHTETYVTD